MRPSCAALALFLLLSGPAARAEALPPDPAPEAAPLGLDAICELVLARSASLRLALLAADSARLEERLAGLDRLPELSASAGAGLDYELSPAASGSSASLGLRASQALYEGGRGRLEARIAALGSESARAAALGARAEALRSAESAYYGLLEAEAAVAQAESALAASRSALELAEARREAGALSPAELLEARSAAASKASALSQARRGLALARASLESLAGLAPGTPVAGLDFAPYEARAAALASLSEGEAEELAARLLGRAAGSPELLQAALARRRAEGQAELSRRQDAPSVSASYSHSFRYAGRSGLSAGSGSLGLSASLPIDPLGARARAESAGLEESRAALEEEEARRAFELGLRGELYGLLAAARDMPSSALALEYAEKRLEAVLELYDRAAASAKDLREAQAEAEAARKALLSARFGFLDYLSELRARLGLAGEADLLGLLS